MGSCDTSPNAMEASPAHSPTPWAISIGHSGLIYSRVGNLTNEVARCGASGVNKQAATDARHIVRCVNSHADLLEALKECLREHGGFTIRGECERRALAAIAKAESR